MQYGDPRKQRSHVQPGEYQLQIVGCPAVERHVELGINLLAPRNELSGNRISVAVTIQGETVSPAGHW